MINPKELRVGNRIKSGIIVRMEVADGFIYSMEIITDKKERRYISNPTGEELTEEWLLFSFDNNNCKHLGIDTSFKTLQVTKDGDVLVYDDKDDFVCLKSIKYVHQLQNLYFALTGEELEIK